MTITIGGFDGMHVAHQQLINKSEFIFIIEKGSDLTPGLDRCEYTTHPCKFLYLNDIKEMSATNFIQYLKQNQVKKIVVGEDFKFGKDRKGDLNLLKKHFETEIVKEIKIDGMGVHSRNIRKFLSNGEIKKANLFLGHTYKIKGVQIKGQGLGSKALLPTINVKLLKNYHLPKNGVYVTKTNSLPSVTFVGIRSTDGNFSIETHVLKDFEKDFELVKIEFLDFIRENEKFDSLEDLKRQIEKDVKKAKKTLNVLN